MNKSRFSTALLMAAMMGFASPVHNVTPRMLQPSRKREATTRSRTRKISYGETLRAHFAAKNLTPQRIAAHKAYVAKHA